MEVYLVYIINHHYFQEVIMSQNELEELASNPVLEKLRSDLLKKIYEMVGILFAEHSTKSLMTIYKGLQESRA